MNIFENAKFGDKFKTRDGRIVIFLKKNNTVADVIDSNENIYDVNVSNGRSFSFAISGDDIISRCDEPIDEEKLDKLAKEYSTKECTNILDESCQDILEIGYKAGYCKAEQEYLSTHK